MVRVMLYHILTASCCKPTKKTVTEDHSVHAS